MLAAIYVTALIAGKEWRRASTGIEFAKTAANVSDNSVLTAATSMMGIQTAADQTGGKKRCEHKYAIEHESHSNEATPLNQSERFAT